MRLKQNYKTDEEYFFILLFCCGLKKKGGEMLDKEATFPTPSVSLRSQNESVGHGEG